MYPSKKPRDFPLAGRKEPGSWPALQVALSHAFALAFDDTFHVLVVGAVIATGMGFILRRLALQSDATEQAEQGVEVPRGAVVQG